VLLSVFDKYYPKIIKIGQTDFTHCISLGSFVTHVAELWSDFLIVAEEFLTTGSLKPENQACLRVQYGFDQLFSNSVGSPHPFRIWEFPFLCSFAGEINLIIVFLTWWFSLFRCPKANFPKPSTSSDRSLRISKRMSIRITGLTNQLVQIGGLWQLRSALSKLRRFLSVVVAPTIESYSKGI